MGPPMVSVPLSRNQHNQVRFSCVNRDLCIL
uniref:Uncharacterized protein n=1 Tax=Anguilla anguilla TaxID=7936 RepID=A0A0E9QPT8_ANGAN